MRPAGFFGSLLALFVAASPAGAAFEIRPTSELSSPLLPSFLPEALASAVACPARGRAGWSIGALHLAPESAARLWFDAAGARVDRDRWAWRAGVARLELPGYAEWEASLCLASAAGLALEAGAFRTQPSDALRSLVGIEPRRAASLSASCARPLAGGVTAAAWARDVVAAGDRRALGITARLGGRLEISPIEGWTASVLREWGGSARPRTRVSLTWRPWSGWRLGHVRGPGDGGESTGLEAEIGPLDVVAWSARLAAGVPGAPGIAVGCRREHAARAGASGSVGRPPAVVSIAPADSSRVPGAWDDWEREPGEELLVIDGAAVPAWSAADSLGAWVDSLEDGVEFGRPCAGAASDRADASPDPAGAALRDGESPRLRAVPWSRLCTEDIPEVAGADDEARERFLAAVRSRGPRALAGALAAAPDPAVRRLLLATAPYASTRLPLPSLAGARSLPRPVARWRREVRSSGGQPARTSDRVELHAVTAGIGIDAAGRRPTGADWRKGSWTARLDGHRVLAAAGRGSLPLTWGTGLWLRSRTMEVRTTRVRAAVAGRAVRERDFVVEEDDEAREKPPPPPQAQSRPRSGLALSSSGTDPFVAGEVKSGSGGALLSAMSCRDRTWIAGEVQGAQWRGGLLAGLGGAGGRLGAMVSAAGSGATHEVEIGIERRGPVRLALRSAGIATLSGRARTWWDLEARTLLVPTGIPARAGAAAEVTSPDRRLRLRGTLTTGAVQAGAAVEAWSDDGDANALDARRNGRSLQLRTTVRRRPLGALTLRATGSRGRTVREEDGERRVRASSRVRLHATVDTGDAPAREHVATAWLVDMGWDCRASRATSSSGASGSRREGGWLGLGARCVLGDGTEASVGMLDACAPPGGVLAVTPGWSGGGAFTAGRSGLWGAGRARWRVARLALEARGCWPVFPAREGARPASASWTLACGVEPWTMSGDR